MSTFVATAGSGPAMLAGPYGDGRDVNMDGTDLTFMQEYWMFFSAITGTLGLIVALAMAGGKSSSEKPMIHNPLWIGWLSVIFYCLHQLEEHCYDIRGWRYAFNIDFNATLGLLLFPSTEGGPCAHAVAVNKAANWDMLNCPIDPKLCLWINTGAIWIGFGGCMLFATFLRESHPHLLFVGRLNWGIAFLNALVGHVLPMVITRKYNPGALQSSVMVVVALYYVMRSGRPLVCLVYGMLWHMVGFGVMINVMLRGALPEATTMFGTMILLSLVLPLGMASKLNVVGSSGSGSNTDYGHVKLLE